MLDTNTPHLAAAARANLAGGGPGHCESPGLDQLAGLWRVSCRPTATAPRITSDDTTAKEE
ncbi:hypothetical protein [Streptacidiphilus anmyonensis]|uniref:hypothetical protein n=1 Tax=Streptacidiphilus anmyonensis TaxID=405782 RepID=UPI000B3253E8|nr:hypothetical protein [Streptacidiphilus anmyonensis]